MLRRVIFVLMFHVSVLNLSAKNVSDMLTSIPIEEMPYMTHEQLSELVNLKHIDPNSSACLTTVLKSQICLDSLTEDFLVLSAGEVVYELARLNNVSDSVFCFLRTIVSPEKETTGYIVNDRWDVISEIDFNSFNLVERQEGVTDKEFSEIKSLIEFPIVEAHFDGSPNVIKMHLNCQALNEEEKEKVKSILVQRKLKWEGESYK